MSFTFNSVDFESEYDVIMVEEYRIASTPRGQGIVMSFPGTEARRSYRGAPKEGIISLRVAFPLANLENILLALNTTTMETLTIEGNSWDAIWDGDQLHMDIAGDYALSTIRFLT